MPAAVLWLMRWLGRFLLAASSGIVLAVIAWQLVRGGFDAGALRTTPRDLLVFRNSCILAAAAVLGAHLLAMPVILVLARLPSAGRDSATSGSPARGVITGLSIIPLICMPSIYAYAWLLIAPSGVPLLQAVPRAPLLEAVAHGQMFHAAWVLALWLWPIPALVLSAAFRHVGQGAYRMALLDTTPTLAFFRGAWPSMRPALYATAAAVAILALTDSTVPPLVLTPDVWSVEMNAKAAVAASMPHASARLLLESWPMLVLLIALAALAFPGIRQMLCWGDMPDVNAGRAAGSPTGLRAVMCGGYVAILALSPLAVFAVTLGGGRYDVAESFHRAGDELRQAAPATLTTALAAGLAAVCMAAAVLTPPGMSRPARWLASAMVAIAFVGAVLPPALSATALIAFFSSETVSPRELWNIYDNSPAVWIAGLLVRFSFIPIGLALLLGRRTPAALVDHAAMETNSPAQIVAAASWPLFRRAVYAAGLLVACLSLSEVQISTLLQPPQWGGGSLAVVVDSQMHYGRHNRTVAMAILMMGPALLAAMILPWALHGAGRVLRKRASTVQG